jgi:hypothetical protein
MLARNTAVGRIVKSAVAVIIHKSLSSWFRRQRVGYLMDELGDKEMMGIVE